MSPSPSRLGCLVCMATVSGSPTWSSNTSSQVITRSRGGMAAARQLRVVVFPDWVAPATTMLSPVTTAASRNRAHWPLIVPSRTSSASECARSTNRRMLIAQWRRVMSGMTTWSREPSPRVASTNGLDRSTRRPLARSMSSTRS